MVLDSKQMDWASREGLDTAALKRAKVPIFGKWYFPDLPDNVPLVNLSTGEVESFPAGYRAGAVLYVKEEDLKRAGLGPYKAVGSGARPGCAGTPAAEAPAAEPVAVAAAPAAPLACCRAGAGPGAGGSRPGGGRPCTRAAAHLRPGCRTMPRPTAIATDAAAHADEHAHPGPRTYITIALILSVITAVEVAVYYIPVLLPYIFPILIVLSTVKFVMVVGWFMHLKFDHVSYTWYFGGGLALALSIVGGVDPLADRHPRPAARRRPRPHPPGHLSRRAPAAPKPSGGGGH